MSARVLGVDIGSSAVRVAEVEVRQKGRATGVLRAFGSANLPPNVVHAGSVVDAAALGAAIRHAVSAAGARCRTAIVGIGAPSIAARELTLPLMPLAEARRSLSFHVDDVLPMPADEAVLDFYPTSGDEVDSRPVMNGILVAVSKDMVTQVLGATDKAGLDLKAIDLSAFAIYRALSDGGTDSKTVAFVDLGARVTTVAVYSRGTPRVIRHLDGGTLSITDGIASSLGIPFDDAYNALHGVVVSGLTNEAIAAIRSQTDALFDGIRQTIQYYGGGGRVEPIAEIVLTGGGSMVPNLPQALASTSRLPVSLGDVMSHVTPLAKIDKGKLEASRSLLAAAIGLTLRETP